MTFLIILENTDILCNFRLVLERKQIERYLSPDTNIQIGVSRKELALPEQKTMPQNSYI